MLNILICSNLFRAMPLFRLMLEIAAFVASHFGSIFSLSVSPLSLFAQFDTVEFYIGQQRNGFMPLRFNILVDLIQFPVLMNHALNLHSGETFD